jgi:Zn finger protein HypA/HybF involved in hydrogenase expression
MGTRRQTPAHEITPPEFLAEHLDDFDADRDRVADVSTDEIAEALRSAERQRSTTPDCQRPRCPECGSLELRIKPGGVQNDAERVDTPYRCEACGEHVHAVSDDDESDATALATDGGRRRRWSAFGG